MHAAGQADSRLEGRSPSDDTATQRESPRPLPWSASSTAVRHDRARQ